MPTTDRLKAVAIRSKSAYVAGPDGVTV